MAIEYRRRPKSNIWHWCTNCTDWPFLTENPRPFRHPTEPKYGELCNQCKAKAEAGDCH